MKKTLLVALAAVALGLSSSALAQTAGPAGLPPQSPVGAKAKLGGKGAKGVKSGRMSKAQMDKINADVYDKLGLTADQKAKIMAHEKESEEKLVELKKANKGAGKSEEVREKAKAIKKGDKDFLKTILDKKQMREMAKLRREEIEKYKASQNPATPVKP